MTKEEPKYFSEKITEKRRKTNPYISKVEKDKNIIIDEKIIFEKSGKWNDFFWNTNNIVLEIWTWHWNFFSEEVSKNLDKNFIWVELKYKRLFSTSEKSRKKWENKNFILLKTKWENIDKFLWDSEISKTYVFFPDPWGKKERQKKHRLFSEKFIKDLYQKTKIWWKLVFKTDHREYFDSSLELFEKINLWKKNILSYDYEADDINYDKTQKTEFETIFDEKKICYVEFEK